MKRKTIAVVFGGNSNEYDVSLRSAYAVITNLDSSRYQVVMLGITKEGRWFHYKGPLDNIPADTWHLDENVCTQAILSPCRSTGGIVEFTKEGPKTIQVDAVFPVVHGRNGEDGTLAGLIELSGVPLIGCDTLSGALCMDKIRSKRLVAAAGVPSSAFITVSKNDDAKTIFEKMQGMRLPVFVKPVRSGSSLGISKVHKEQDLMDAIAEAFKHDHELIIEENVEGVEVGCAIIGKDTLDIGEVDEIELQIDWFDYVEKYTQNHSVIHMPARFCQEIKERVKESALQVFRALGCVSFARVDLFLTPEGQIYFNEVNTIPGLTEHSRFPKMMKGIGLEFPELLNRLAGQVLGE